MRPPSRRSATSPLPLRPAGHRGREGRAGRHGISPFRAVSALADRAPGCLSQRIGPTDRTTRPQAPPQQAPEPPPSMAWPSRDALRKGGSSLPARQRRWGEMVPTPVDAACAVRRAPRSTDSHWPVLGSLRRNMHTRGLGISPIKAGLGTCGLGVRSDRRLGGLLRGGRGGDFYKYFTPERTRLLLAHPLVSFFFPTPLFSLAMLFRAALHPRPHPSGWESG